MCSRPATSSSPIFESPLGLFRPDAMGAFLEKTYRIPQRRLTGICSPWAAKRLDQFDGDLSKFSVVKMYPSKLRQICVAKTEPGDDNNQDISALVGKVDIRKLEHYSQHDPDAYSYSGGLNRTTQGLLEFVEMFKAPIKVLHPLLTATQEGNYVGTENIGAMPYQGVVLAHSNESEWEQFKHNKNNEAFLDRICVVKVPYCLRVTEEAMIYAKLLETSDLGSRALRARGARDPGALLDPVAPQGAPELADLFQAARLQWRKPEGHRPEGEVDPGISRGGGRLARACRAFRPASRSKCCRRPSTTTARRSPPIPCI